MPSCNHRVCETIRKSACISDNLDHFDALTVLSDSDVEVRPPIGMDYYLRPELCDGKTAALRINFLVEERRAWEKSLDHFDASIVLSHSDVEKDWTITFDQNFMMAKQLRFESLPSSRKEALGKSYKKGMSLLPLLTIAPTNISAELLLTMPSSCRSGQNKLSARPSRKASSQSGNFSCAFRTLRTVAYNLETHL